MGSHHQWSCRSKEPPVESQGQKGIVEVWKSRSFTNDDGMRSYFNELFHNLYIQSYTSYAFFSEQIATLALFSRHTRKFPSPIALGKD